MKIKKSLVFVMMLLLVFLAFAGTSDNVRRDSHGQERGLVHPILFPGHAELAMLDPLFNYSLYINQSGGVENPYQFETAGTGLWNISRNATIEGWFNLNRTSLEQNLTLFAINYNNENQVWLVVGNGGGHINLTLINRLNAFGTAEANGTLVYSKNVTNQSWMHFAYVFYRNNTGYNRSRLFVNGEIAGTLNNIIGNPNTPPTPKLYVAGHGENTSENWFGGIDEFRVSQTARYLDAFTPPTRSFPADNTTLALYHFNQMASNLLLELIINNSAVQRGITNEFWVRTSDSAFGKITIEAPNGSLFNRTVYPKDTFWLVGNATFSTIGEYNITRVFTYDLSSWNDTRFANKVYNVVLQTEQFKQCDLPVFKQHVAVNFTFQDEINFSMLNVNFDASIIFWNVTNVSATQNLTLSFDNVGTVALCINPSEAQYQANMTLQYQKDGYQFRNYYFVNNTLNNVTQNITTYLLDIAEATAITFQVNDELNNPFTDAIIKVQRFNISTGSFYLIAMGKTDEAGTDLIYLQQIEPFYRFLIERDGTLQFISGKKRVTTNSLQFNILPDTIKELFDKFAGVSFSFTNSTLGSGELSFNVTYTDTTGGVNLFCLEAKRLGPINETALCKVCITANSGDLGCPFTKTNGTFIGSFYSKINPISLNEQRIIQFQEFFKDTIGLDGVVYSLLIMGTISAVGTANPVVGLMLVGVGLFVIYNLGFLALSYSVLLALLVVIIIFGVNMKR